MADSTEALLNRVLSEDGPIRILIYRSVSPGVKGEPRVVAQSVLYGQIATGSTPSEALRRVVVQIVAYLTHCDREQFAQALGQSEAPDEVLRAWSTALEYRDIPEDLVRFFAPRHAKGFRDPELHALLQVHETPRVLEPV